MSGPNAVMNLEIRCAEVGKELAEIEGMQEKAINDALTVLEEQGPYAMFLYVKARHKNQAGEFCERILKFLKEVFGNKIEKQVDALEAIKELSESLDDLLFAREILRTALGYARFHRNAKGR